MLPAPVRGPVSDPLAAARRVLLAEAHFLRVVADRMDDGIRKAVELLAKCRGRVAVCGVGKCEHIGRKLAATLNSTGSRSYYLDVTAAMHGDLGMVAPDDMAILLTHSGESDEMLRLMPSLSSLCAGTVAITGNAAGTVAKQATAAVVYGDVVEACPNQLAPSTSATIMLALGDAIAFALSERKGFTSADFGRIHPAGTLGRKLATVEQYMRRGNELRIASATDTVRKVFAAVRHDGRRTGAVMLVDAGGVLVGLFTDSDLARLFESRQDAAFDLPVSRVMTKAPVTTTPLAKLPDAVALLQRKKISELPVVDAAGRPVGMLDITDVIGLDSPKDPAGTRPPLRLFDKPPG
jgi:arabinose-5-phosphate isomerase